MPNPTYMPLRYINCKCIMMPLAITKISTHDLHTNSNAMTPQSSGLQDVYIILSRENTVQFYTASHADPKTTNVSYCTINISFR